MNAHHSQPNGINRRQTLLALLGAAGLSACGGGGGDVAGVGAGGTGSFSVGPITGLGSIIVNGIRYDDTSASISSDDSPFRREDLRLGMVVAVQGSPAVNGQSTATRIVLGGELVGPIATKGTDTLEVLGQTVNIQPNTVFANTSGFAALNTNDVVEVHGIADPATNSLDATYVERKTSVSEYRIQGRVTAHDAAPSKIFSIGSLRLDYSATPTDRVRVTPTAGALVRVRLGTTATGGVYPVNRIRKPEDSFSGFSGEVEFKGTITAFTSSASFSVNDLPVNASGAAFPEGTSGIVAGAFVEIKGSLVNGVVVATRVKPEDDAGTGASAEFELHGTLSAPSVSGSGGAFTLTSSGGVVVQVDWDSSTTFPRAGESPAILTTGRRVEVKGLVTASSRVRATRIKTEDN